MLLGVCAARGVLGLSLSVPVSVCVYRGVTAPVSEPWPLARRSHPEGTRSSALPYPPARSKPVYRIPAALWAAGAFAQWVGRSGLWKRHVTIRWEGASGVTPSPQSSVT